MTTRTTFIPGDVWPDNNGIPINAHGGGVLFHKGAYYWFGEHKIEGEAGNLAHVGVHCYSSTDLYNWTDEGIALPVSNQPGSDIEAGCIIERPKVIYNPHNSTFVMWFHHELKGQGYFFSRVGVAVAEQPAGPYTFLRTFRPNAGHWPMNGAAAERLLRHDAVLMEEMRQFRGGGVDPSAFRYPFYVRDFDGGQMSRDMTLFVDDDGTAYQICASEENGTLHISALSDDFLSTTGQYVRVFDKRWHEAPAICRHAGRYWMITSDCTGWAPNAARLSTATSIWGPWSELGNPTEGVNLRNGLGPDKTFGGQSTFLLKVNGKAHAYIAMFDIWEPSNAIAGRYIWLPVQFAGGKLIVRWRDEWSLDDLDESSPLL